MPTSTSVAFKRGLFANLPAAKTAGQFLVATDTKELFLDVDDNTRIRLDDFEPFATLADLEENPNPSADKLYYITALNVLEKYNGTGYTQINVNTDTQYKIEQDATDGHILHLSHKALGDANWTADADITIPDNDTGATSFVLMQSILDTIKEIAPWLAIGSVIVEIAPIKLNPWSWIARKVGAAINKDQTDKIVALERKVDEMECGLQNVKSSLAEKDAKDARAAILRFGDELIFYPNRKYSKDRFDEIAQYITDYDKYCDEHPDFQNHMTQSTSKLILEEYKRRMMEHDFL